MFREYCKNPAQEGVLGRAEMVEDLRQGFGLRRRPAACDHGRGTGRCPLASPGATGRVERNALARVHVLKVTGGFELDN